jgi:hypothetical protein
MSERAFPFLRVNEREGKPRTRGIIENVKTWRTDALGPEKVMFEAADPEVFAWYIKNYGAEVNLFMTCVCAMGRWKSSVEAQRNASGLSCLKGRKQ